MEKSLVVLIAMTILTALFMPQPVSAESTEGFNLLPYARVTATGTRNTFFLLWPRETDDAPATVRDGDIETSWKTPINDEQTLTIDFAPTNLWPIEFSTLIAQWAKLPSGNQVAIRVSDACGGNSVFEAPWDVDQNRFDFPEAVRGYCLEIVLENPGAAALESLQVFASPATEMPEIGEVSMQATGDSLSVSWQPMNKTVHHVELHFVTAEGQTTNTATLIDVDLLPDPWQGPLPPSQGYFLAVVPVAADGTKGEVQYLEIPGRLNPLMPSCGVIEGFYGRPWSPIERRNMLLFMARIGMGAYVYGPKNDPLHRDNWREPYSDDKIDEFAELECLAQQLGIAFAFGISPGKDIDTEDQADRQALVDKLTSFVDIGVTSFVLLFDDIEGDIAHPINADLGAEHVELANWLLQQLDTLADKQVTLWFVPTVYSSERQNDWPDGVDYLLEMSALDPRIGLMWTGTGTSEDTLSAADIAEVNNMTGRKPITWDNQHATDGGDGFWGHVYLAPIGSANRMMLYTYAEYLHDPIGYDPNQALVENADLIGATTLDRLLVLRQARSYYGHAGSSLLDQHNYPEMERALKDFREKTNGGDQTAIADAAAVLMKIAAEMVVSQNDLWHSGLDPLLVDDLWFPAQQLIHDGFTILHTLDFVRDRLSGQDGTESQIEAQRYMNLSAFDRYQLSPFVVAFWKRSLAKAALPAIPFSAPTILPPTTNNAEVESLWQYDTGLTGNVSVYGLPGAEITNGVVAWTPNHAGEYQAVVVANAQDGWAWLELSVFVSGEPSLSGDDDDNDDHESDDDDESNNGDDDAGDDDDNDQEDGCGC